MKSVTESIAAIEETIRPFPRAGLVLQPTPVEPCNQLSKRMGIELSVKRDDLSSIMFGGNKTRQLDFYFGEALANEADTVLITGAVQSNYVRAAATVAAKYQMKPVLQLESRVQGMGTTYETSGNVLLGELLGADYIRYPNGEDEAGADAALHEAANALRLQGRKPYVIPLGVGQPPLGALGYLQAVIELLPYLASLDAIVVASGSGLTHAGLLAGLRICNCDIPVFGICVRRDKEAQRQRVLGVIKSIETLCKRPIPVIEQDVLTWDGSLAPGYGQLNKASAQAMSDAAKYEGLFLDPVYTAKSFAGVAGLLNDKVLNKGDRVLFIHTGGTPSIFAYQDEIATALKTLDR